MAIRTKYRYTEVGLEIPRQLRFRAFLGCEEIMDLLAPGVTMLDIGGGDGLHARYFRKRGLKVDILDLQEGMEPLIHAGSYETFRPGVKYDVIWCSHVFEHIINPGVFMSKIFYDLKPGGYAVVTVPPMKSDMLFEHVTLWNPGLLLIHLIKAGFDCRQARVGSYHYNITVIAQRPLVDLKLPDDRMLPAVERNGGYFNGEIKFLNWKNQKLSIDKAYDLRTSSMTALLDKIEKDKNPPSFAFAKMQATGRDTYMYIDHDKRIVCPVG